MANAAKYARGGESPTISFHASAPGGALALARGLARAMAGDLTLDAPSGRGASFRLALPARSG